MEHFQDSRQFWVEDADNCDGPGDLWEAPLIEAYDAKEACEKYMAKNHHAMDHCESAELYVRERHSRKVQKFDISVRYKPVFTATEVELPSAWEKLLAEEINVKAEQLPS